MTEIIGPTYWCNYWKFIQFSLLFNLHYPGNSRHSFISLYQHYATNRCQAISNHHANQGKNTVSQICERQEAQILKFNAPPPTHLVCHVHLIANFLSFHMSLVVVVNCGAGNALRGFEISMFYFFLKLYSIHLSKDKLLLRAQNAIKQCK